MSENGLESNVDNGSYEGQAVYRGSFSSASSWTVVFNYAADDDPNDGVALPDGVTASMEFNGITYTGTGDALSCEGVASNPATCDQFSYASASATLTVPPGWTQVTSTAAPELNAGSTGSAVTLLLGTLAIMHGRRRGSDRRSAA